MLRDYESLVALSYQQKKADTTLPLELMHPTPARLREVCLSICEELYDKKDERTLKAFFGNFSDKAGCLQAIDHCDINKFKPLIKFLKQSIGTTDVKNVELLAWLIDFRPRPFEYDKKYEVTSLPVAGASQTGAVTAAPTIPVGGPKKPTASSPLTAAGPTDGAVEKGKPALPAGSKRGKMPGFNTRAAIITLVIAMVVGIGAFLFWSRKAVPVLTGQEACMYWADDHYRLISCAQKLENVQIIALDSARLVHFRKITQPDTITEQSKGKVWYVKYNGQLEYYTSDGFHPIDPRLRLKPITDYMIRKHIHPAADTDQTEK
jgi:hypothetical protein